MRDMVAAPRTSDPETDEQEASRRCPGCTNKGIPPVEAVRRSRRGDDAAPVRMCGGVALEPVGSDAWARNLDRERRHVLRLAHRRPGRQSHDGPREGKLTLRLARRGGGGT